MLSEDQLIRAVQDASRGHPILDMRLTLCEKLTFIYDVLMELKNQCPWHWQVGIRAIHGLISKTKNGLNCA